ncbi:hypothetical protein B0G75_102539 [Paraburkholderia sp. BL18I3N2]|nr:hypothetical protein B0G75_102539 [Paraburkholderia sp. BL18I3N2]
MRRRGVGVRRCRGVGFELRTGIVSAQLDRLELHKGIVSAQLDRRELSTTTLHRCRIDSSYVLASRQCR